MPRSAKKTSSTYKTTKTTEKTNTSRNLQKTGSPAIKKEAKCLGLAACGLLLLIGVFFPTALGPVGGFIRGFLLGLLGVGAFVLPIGLIVMAVLTLMARRVRVPVIQSILLGWFVLSFLHIINRLINSPPEYLVGFEYIGSIYSNGGVFGGGVVGALLGEVLRFFVNDVGAIIVLVVGIIILLVLLTGRSFVDFVGQGVDKAKDIYDEHAARRYDDESELEYNESPSIFPRKKRSDGLRPLPHRRTVRNNNDDSDLAYFEIDADDFEETEKILLVQEEIEQQSKQKAVNGPLFARRGVGAQHVKREKKAEILPFHEKRAGSDSTVSNVIDISSRNTSISAAPVIRGLDNAAPPLNETSHMEVEVKEPYAEASKIEVEIFNRSVSGYSNAHDAVDDEFEAEDEIDEEVLLFENDDDSDKDYENLSIKINSAVPLQDGDPFEDGAENNVPSWVKNDVSVADSKPDEDISEDDFDDSEDVLIPVQAAVPVAPPRFAPMPEYHNYQLPPISFLAKNDRPQANAETRTQVHKNSLILEETLRNFRIDAKVVEVSIGPSVTRYDLTPGPGVKVSAIANLSNDLALALAAQGIRIEAPIPGKSAVGIEIPNKDPQGVFLREILEDEKFETFPSKLAFAVGKDIAGAPVVTDVAKMPHLLIAGATGSGKSVCINTLIASLLYKSRPDEVKLLMIDPKVVELSVYNGIPHLLIPVVTDPKKASGALSWAVQEMENRYAAFAETGCRDLKGYNRHMMEKEEQRLPQIVIIIDELADLMMTCKGEVEESICRLAQKARAAGIHLIVATQRPSVDVITGLIKANIPSRLAFAVSSGTDSRTVLDMYGAEKLLGRGDMLFLPIGQNKPIRVQGGFISDKEVENLVNFLKAQAPVEHTTEMIQQITMPGKAKVEGDVDEFFYDAVEFLLTKGKASTSMLQRQFRIGYNRASRLMEDLEIRGIVGPEDGVKPRKVTITKKEYQEIYGQNE